MKTESRDLTSVFYRIREEVYDDNLDVLLMVVHDNETDTMEALYVGSDRACEMVDAIQERIKLIKKRRLLESEEKT